MVDAAILSTTDAASQEPVVGSAQRVPVYNYKPTLLCTQNVLFYFCLVSLNGNKCKCTV